MQLCEIQYNEHNICHLPCHCIKPQTDCMRERFSYPYGMQGQRGFEKELDHSCEINIRNDQKIKLLEFLKSLSELRD